MFTHNISGSIQESFGENTPAGFLLFASQGLLHVFQSNALEDTLMSISIVVTGPTSSQHHPMSYVCLENRRICFALLELFSSVLKENVYAVMKFQVQLEVTNYLMHIIEKPFDYNVASEALKLLGTVISLNDKFSVLLPGDTKAKLVHLLCKKLMDKTEAIAICALSVAGLILSQDGETQSWRDAVSEHNLHQIVWEMGVDGIQDGMLKAAALHATLRACKVPHLWKDIQLSKKVNQEDVLKIFFRYYRDPDFYVQRESLTCMFEWLKDKETELPLTCKDTLLIILSEAIKSLDMDQKDVALKAWIWLIESEHFFPGVSKNIDSLLRAVCESGFASSLVLAVEDSDEPIQYQATKILIGFRETLLKMGCTADYEVAEDSKLNPSQTKPVSEFSFTPISKEERDVGIENVMKLTTAEQIAKLAFIPDISSDADSAESVPVQADHLVLPASSFLKYLWSSDLDSIVSKPVASTDLFSEHTLWLLDDIIASDVKDVCPPLDDIPDCY